MSRPNKNETQLLVYSRFTLNAILNAFERSQVYIVVANGGEMGTSLSKDDLIPGGGMEKP